PREGQNQEETCPAPQFALDPEIATMEPRELACECKPQARAGEGPRHRPVDLYEAFKNAFVILGRNADPRIDHIHPDLITATVCFDANHASGRSELERV